MQRRRFISLLCAVPAVGYASVIMQGCGSADDASHAHALKLTATASVQSFGYYQGLGPHETRSPSRADGTSYDMPCISAADIIAGVEKQYVFWHGHGQNHTFTVTADHFKLLQEGKKLELYTSIVQGHRHALLINPTSRCQPLCPA